MMMHTYFRKVDHDEAIYIYIYTHIYIYIYYPLVNIQKAIEHGPFIVDVPIKHGKLCGRHVDHGHLRSDRYGYGVRRTQPGHERPAMLVFNVGQLYLPCLPRIEKGCLVFLF